MFSTSADQHVTDRGLAPLVQSDGPTTAVMISPAESGMWFSFAMRRGANSITAAAVLAVLQAAADQVSTENLFYFNVAAPTDLKIRELALVHRADDTGMLGDVFEYAVTAALNQGEPEVVQLTADALSAIGERGEVLGAIIAGAERGRAKSSIPLLPDGQTYVTGRRGRRPLVANLLDSATTKHWKNDILVMTTSGAIGATLKSNPSDVGRHLQECTSLKYPPRLAFVPVHRHEAGIRRDRNSGVMVVKLPVDIPFLAMLQHALTTVQAAFARQLAVPRSALADPGGVIGFLQKRRDASVGDVMTELGQIAMNDDVLSPHISAPTALSDINETRESGNGGALIVVAGAFTDPESRGLVSRPTLAWGSARRAVATFSA